LRPEPGNSDLEHAQQDSASDPQRSPPRKVSTVTSVADGGTAINDGRALSGLRRYISHVTIPRQSFSAASNQTCYGRTSRSLSALAPKPIPPATRSTPLPVHDTPMMAHRGITQTLDSLSRRFYWPHMREDVVDWISGCSVCVASKISRQKANRAP
jgi:hypothetical protein